MRLFVLLPLLAACGVDSVGANGELGNMTFGLISDWYLDQTDLTEVGIVTGHAQGFLVSLTEKGQRLTDEDADAIEYAMAPADGVTISQSAPDDDEQVEHTDPPALALSVTEPGDYTLSARLNGVVVDHIQLRFERPAALDLALFVRAPWTEEFERLESGAAPTEVREGTQLAWLPIPMGADGTRLVGDVTASMSAAPEEVVVPADNVTHVNEDEVYDGVEVPSLYFIEPGDVTVSLTDLPNVAVGAQMFTVTE